MKKVTLSSLDKKLDTILELLNVQSKEVKPATGELDSDKYIKLEMKDYMTAKYLFGECKKLFPIYIWDESYLDGVVSDRKGNYTVYFKNIQEADEYPGLSANHLKEKGIQGCTLEERMLLEIEYFKKTGKNMDLTVWTICSGSRFRDGRVAHFFAHPGLVYVYCVNPDYADPNARVRPAVFLDTEAKRSAGAGGIK